MSQPPCLADQLPAPRGRGPLRRSTPLRSLRRGLRWVAVAATLGAGAIASPWASAQTAELAPTLQKLATCEDSWYDLRRDAARMQAIGAALRAQFTPQDRNPAWKPNGPVSWLGAEVLELTPESVGMGLGFAVTLKSPLASVQPAYERQLGQALGRCEVGDGMRTCELKLADKRTAVLMAPLNKPELGTLVGCYYFYQQ